MTHRRGAGWIALALLLALGGATGLAGLALLLAAGAYALGDRRRGGDRRTGRDRRRGRKVPRVLRRKPRWPHPTDPRPRWLDDHDVLSDLWRDTR